MRRITSRKVRKNHIRVDIGCPDNKRKKVVNEEIRKAISRIEYLTDNKVSYEIEWSD